MTIVSAVFDRLDLTTDPAATVEVGLASASSLALPSAVPSRD